MTLIKARRTLLSRLQNRKHREREGCFVVEGVRSAHAALTAATPVRFAVVSPRLANFDESGAVAEMLGRGRFDVVTLEDKELAAVSATITPQGVLLVCEEPTVRLSDIDPTRAGILVADAIQDPANLGVMLRSAAAFGLAGVVVLEGSVDPWNDKVVRGSAGASFRIPVVRATSNELIEWANNKGTRLLAADMGGNDARTTDKTLPWALVIGNEGAGLRRLVRQAASATIAVPIEPSADSLNAGVSAAILCYELTRTEQ